MDKILERFRAIKWHHAPRDEAARAELDRRIAEVGRRRGLITYSDLVRGITVNLSNLREPRHQIDTGDWQDLDRAILADFLGYLSMESYERAGFLEFGMIASSKTDKAMYLWADHVAKAHTWYAKAP